MNLPLEGITVVELGTHVVVPNAGRFFADWGAMVIKVEAVTGEEWRKVGPSYCTPMTSEENPLFQEQNANKKLVGINLKTDAGMDAFLRLISKADVFLSNVRMKSLEKLGIDYKSLQKINSSIIYGHFTGYGYDGPEAARPGFDMSTFWARSGAMRDWTELGGFPFKPPGGFGDSATSASFTAGILAALVARQASSQGTLVTSSLQACGLWYNQTGIISSQYGNTYPASRMTARNPFTHIYQCKDGEYLIITVPDYGAKYDKVMCTMGLEQYCGDDRYKDRTAEGLFKGQNLYDFLSIMNQRFMELSRDEWCTIFHKADIACESLLHMKQVVDDEQAIANDCLKQITFPSSKNRVSFPTVPVRFSAYPVTRLDLPKSVGCNSKEVLSFAGYSDQEFECMRSSGSIL